MQLQKLNNLLKVAFEKEESLTHLPDGMVLHTQSFESDFLYSLDEVKELATPSAKEIVNSGFNKENKKFDYYIVVPKKRQSKEVIVLLHGLNERSWDKYLAWAWYLAKQCEKAVLMFPIAYHINRAPEKWGNPRQMLPIVQQRRLAHQNLKYSSFANIALSLRMEYTPEMFPISGVQTYFDLIKLALSIKTGKHPLFEENTNINIFAYSIGALLAEVLLIANPIGLFSEQKNFFFCGGSTFDKMDANSKAILDSRAAHCLRDYMLNNLEVSNEISLPLQMASLLPKAWHTLKTMLNTQQNIEEREGAFLALRDRIKAIGLTKDRVIPAKAILETLGYGEELDFPFEYCHETPFPLNGKSNTAEIERAFTTVFDQAVDFLK